MIKRCCLLVRLCLLYLNTVVAKHGLNPFKQSNTLFDKELPFYELVMKHMSENVTADNHVIGENSSAAVGSVPEEYASEKEDDDHSSVNEATGNGRSLEDAIGWPRDVIRARRIEILMELVISPSEKCLQMIKTKKRDAARELHQNQNFPWNPVPYTGPRRFGHRFGLDLDDDIDAQWEDILAKERLELYKEKLAAGEPMKQEEFNADMDEILLTRIARKFRKDTKDSTSSTASNIRALLISYLENSNSSPSKTLNQEETKQEDEVLNETESIEMNDIGESFESEIENAEETEDISSDSEVDNDYNFSLDDMMES